MPKKVKGFTRKQRLKIYAKALELFEKYHRTPRDGYQCTGMCQHIDHAINLLRYSTDNRDTAERNILPEYYSYKPKTGWRESPAYWWSRNGKHGIERRLAVLRRLAEGKSKGE